MTNYKLNDSKMFSDITDGIAIIINNETGIYYGLNIFGSLIFDNLLQGFSVEKILSELNSLSDAPNDMANRLNKFIEFLQEKEIIVSDNSNENPSENLIISNEIASEDKFELVAEEYTDAQELLLADPIHEVKEEIGWTPSKDSIGYTKEETKTREAKVQN